MLDEFIHHGAEIAVLRDLWRWQHTSVVEDPMAERVIRGDESVLDEFDARRAAGRARRTRASVRTLGPRGRTRRAGRPAHHDGSDAAARGGGRR